MFDEMLKLAAFGESVPGNGDACSRVETVRDADACHLPTVPSASAEASSAPSGLNVTRREAGLVGTAGGTTRLVLATVGPGTLPDKATWYLATTCPAPAARARPHPAASLAEVVRIYGIRHWTRCWSTARSACAGPLGSLIRRQPPRRRHQAPASGAGDREGCPVPRDRPGRRPGRGRPGPCAWLAPWIALQRRRAAWSKTPPARQLQALISSVASGCGLYLCIPN